MIDLLRRSRRNVGDADAVLEQLAAPEAVRAGEDGYPDDRLRLLFTCCHPALAVPAQTALALRTLCGLSTREIARAFLEPESTTAQDAPRAPQEVFDSGVPILGICYGMQTLAVQARLVNALDWLVIFQAWRIGGV